MFDEARARDTVKLFDASNEDELWKKIADVFGREEWMFYETNTMSYSEGLMEDFCRDEHGELFNDAGAETLRDDLAAVYGVTSNREFQAYLRQCVETNVRKYFGERQDLAELYLQKWASPDAIEFPDEMYEYCFLKDARYAEPPYIIVHEVGEVREGVLLSVGTR